MFKWFSNPFFNSIYNTYFAYKSVAPTLINKQKTTHIINKNNINRQSLLNIQYNNFSNYSQINTATTAIKKRLDKVFLNNEFILVWASLKPIGKHLPYLLTKTCTQNSTGMETGTIKNLSLLLDFCELKNITFPKKSLNKYCRDVYLPMIGCSVEILTLTKLPLNLKIVTKQTQLKKAYKQNDFNQTFKVNDNNLGFSKIVKTQQVGQFLNLILNSYNLQEKWHSNQLLGAFARTNIHESSTQARPSTVDIKKDFFFISSCELQQSLVLLHSYKANHCDTTNIVTQKQMALQPFLGAVSHIKTISTKQNKYICKLFKNLIYITDYLRIR